MKTNLRTSCYVISLAFLSMITVAQLPAQPLDSEILGFLKSSSRQSTASTYESNASNYVSETYSDNEESIKTYKNRLQLAKRILRDFQEEYETLIRIKRTTETDREWVNHRMNISDLRQAIEDQKNEVRHYEKRLEIAKEVQRENRERKPETEEEKRERKKKAEDDIVEDSRDKAVGDVPYHDEINDRGQIERKISALRNERRCLQIEADDIVNRGTDPSNEKQWNKEQRHLENIYEAITTVTRKIERLQAKLKSS